MQVARSGFVEANSLNWTSDILQVRPNGELNEMITFYDLY